MAFKIVAGKKIHRLGPGLKATLAQIGQPEGRWMKEVEDGCIVEFEEMCYHGSSYPTLTWEEK